MSLRRSGTKRVGASGTSAAPKPRKGYGTVQQGVKQLYPELDSATKTDLDIVFVPGLGANPEDSWKSAKTGFNWATDADGVVRDFPTARVLLYMYQSAWTGPFKVKQFINNLALTLLHGLSAKREETSSSRPIVFIGHSMGGLVIAKAVCLADSYRKDFPLMFENIAGCAMFGTPFHGAEAATVAAMVSYVGQMFDHTINSKLLDLMKPEDEGLADLRHEFIRMVTKISPKIGLCGFYEEQPTDINDLSGVPAFIKGLGIPLPKKLAEFVTRESAILGGLMEPMGLASNHRDLVKFDSFKDERYSLVRSPLKKLIHGANLVATNRRQAIRNFDRSMVAKVMETLDASQVSRKRKAISQTTTASLWIPREPQYIEWLARDTGTMEAGPVKRGDCLWIRGPDGRGKTSAALAAIQEIECMIGDTQPSFSVVLAYFFCDGTWDYGTAEELLKSLIQQLINKQETLASHAKFLLKRKGREDARGSAVSVQLTVENLWQVLQDMLADEELKGSRVYFVVNNLQALSPESTSTTTLMNLLKLEVDSLVKNERHAAVRWFVTSGESYIIGEALKGENVRLVDLEHDQYRDQVQLELQMHARNKISALAPVKNYSKALSYFASSLLGRRAQNTQWIDITCIQLEELPQNGNDLRVRLLLEAVPQDLDALLEDAWEQVFEHSKSKAAEIKEMLRVLILTYENPTEDELSLLVGLPSSDESMAELRDLVSRCRPLLRVETTKSETRVCFIENVVKTHLLQNSHRILRLSEEDTRLQHGILCFRAFAHILEAFSFPAAEAREGSADNGDLDQTDAASQASQTSSEQSELQSDGEDGDADGDDRTSISSDHGSSDESDEDEDEEDEDEAPEAEDLKGIALTYAVKHWLHHASKATAEIAEALSLEREFWKKESDIRRRWVTEHNRLVGSFATYQRKEFSGLHIAASIGFKQLVVALLKNGHSEEINLRDSCSFIPLHLAAAFGRLNIVEELLNEGSPIDDGVEEGTMTPLHMAAAEGHVQVMAKLLDRGADPNAYCGTYGRVINAAIESGNCEAVKLLVEKNVVLASDGDSDEGEDEEDGDEGHDDNDDEDEPEDEDRDDDDDDDDDESEDDDDELIESPLALAALRSDLEMFEFLIENYSDKLPPKEFDNALVSAAKAGRVEAFKRLLNSFPHTQEALQDALEEAAWGDNWEIVALLFEHGPGLKCDEAFVYAAQGQDGDPEIQSLEAMWEYSQGGISAEKLDEALYEASDFENIKTVRRLLRFGASPDATGRKYGNALTAAAFDGTMEIVSMLLDAKADLNSPNGYALQTAAAEGHVEIVRLLLEKEADVNASTTHRRMPQGTALQAAVEAGNLEIVEILLDHHADPDLGSGLFTCPIIAAARKGEGLILERLVQSKAAVDVFGGPDRSTPLINAAACLPKSYLRLLLDAGADINLPNSDGDTALMVAALAGDAESVQFLLDQGGSAILRNKSNKNALDNALQSESSECVDILAKHISLILEALRVAIEAGDAGVLAVVRSIESRKQGLEYDEPTEKDTRTVEKGHEDQRPEPEAGPQLQIPPHTAPESGPHSQNSSYVVSGERPSTDAFTESMEKNTYNTSDLPGEASVFRGVTGLSSGLSLNAPVPSYSPLPANSNTPGEPTTVCNTKEEIPMSAHLPASQPLESTVHQRNHDRPVEFKSAIKRKPAPYATPVFRGGTRIGSDVGQSTTGQVQEAAPLPRTSQEQQLHQQQRQFIPYAPSASPYQAQGPGIPQQTQPFAEREQPLIPQPLARNSYQPYQTPQSPPSRSPDHRFSQQVSYTSNLSSENGSGPQPITPYAGDVTSFERSNIGQGGHSSQPIAYTTFPNHGGVQSNIPFNVGNKPDQPHPSQHHIKPYDTTMRLENQHQGQSEEYEQYGRVSNERAPNEYV